MIYLLYQKEVGIPCVISRLLIDKIICVSNIQDEATEDELADLVFAETIRSFNTFHKLSETSANKNN